MLHNSDIGRLLLRLLVGSMMLFHGFDKIVNGINGVKHLTTKAGLPEFVAYGVYVGEVLMPILIILGLYARMASFFVTLNMAIAIYLAYGTTLFELGKHGAPVIEVPLFYLVVSLSIFFLGSGRYSVNTK